MKRTNKSIVAFMYLILGLAQLIFVHTTNAHSEHTTITPRESLELSSTPTSAPAQLGSSSLQLLMKDIPIEGGYGKGWYFEIPKNLEEELVNQGFAMLNMFQYTDSFRSFNTALKLNPDSIVAHIGRALNALNLDGNDPYFIEAAITHIQTISKQGFLDAKTLAWSNMFLAMVTGQDLAGQSLDINQAYAKLKSTDPSNLEIYTAINWIAGINNLKDYDYVLTVDANNAGSLHYLMHIAESQNNHAMALSYGQRMVPLTPNSAHGQHMLGHVLPHFNRWAEADKQFVIADQLHLDWAKRNGFDPNEDWHYGHNLQLLSITKMVFEPELALGVLQTIASYNPGAIIDTLDYLSATFVQTEAQPLENYLVQIENYSVDYKNYVESSRLYFDLVFKSADPNTLPKISQRVAALADFKNKNMIQISLALFDAERTKNTALKTQIYDFLISELNINFSRGGFDGWQQSVIQTLMFKKIFEVYNLQDGLKRIQSEIIDVYMNPNNPK